jgi:hypothetical protein
VFLKYKGSPVEFASVTFLTALIDNPKLLTPETTPREEEIKPKTPIPLGPRKTAIIFDLKILIKMLNNCRLPRIEKDLKIFKKLDFLIFCI